MEAMLRSVSNMFKQDIDEKESEVNNKLSTVDEFWERVVIGVSQCDDCDRSWKSNLKRGIKDLRKYLEVVFCFVLNKQPTLLFL